jgi:hypothetical protein
MRNSQSVVARYNTIISHHPETGSQHVWLYRVARGDAIYGRTVMKRYRRRPEKSASRGDIIISQYQPGEPLDDLRAVAALTDSADAEVTEATFPSGMRVLVAKWRDYPDEHPSEIRFIIVQAGNWLAYSESYDSLFEQTDGQTSQWYELANDPGSA